MDYLDFDLEIETGNQNTYPLVAHSSARQAKATMCFPFDPMELENYRLKLLLALQPRTIRLRKPSQLEAPIQEFGTRLFNALLINDVHALYQEMWQHVDEHEGVGVRLRLCIQAPELVSVPWEYLYDPARRDYLCLSIRTPLVRSLERPKHRTWPQITPPLHILSMVANPSDLDPLDVNLERERLQSAIQDLDARGIATLTWLEGRTWRDLQQALAQKAWHIFHFIGHGQYNREREEGYLAFENEEGKTALMSATEVGRLLADHQSLRLVLLNACEGAQGSEQDLYSSIAATLSQRGVPAVLAMQKDISDRAAIELTQAFYTNLAHGKPLDTAISETRKDMSFALKSLEWGTPVLYLNAPHGRLFELAEPLESSGVVQQRGTTAPADREEQAATVRHKQPQVPAGTPALPSEVIPPVQPYVVPQPPLKTAQEWMGEGEAHLNAREYQHAVMSFRETLHLDPKNAVAYNLLGVAERSLGLYGQALRAHETAILLDSNLVSAFCNKGALLLELHQYAEALETFEQAIILAPHDAFAYTGKGYALLGLQRNVDAYTAFDHAVHLADADFPFAAKGKAYTLQALERSRAGKEKDWRISSLELNTVMAHLKPGASPQAIKHEEEAQARLEEATFIDPEDRQAYLQKAQEIPIPWWLRPDKRALATYERILQQDPNLLPALIRQRKEPLDPALHERLMLAYELATEPKPPDALGYRIKAMMLLVLRRPEEAQKALAKARAIDPTTEIPALVLPGNQQPVPQSGNSKPVNKHTPGVPHPLPRTMAHQGGGQESSRTSTKDAWTWTSEEAWPNPVVTSISSKEGRLPVGGTGGTSKDLASNGCLVTAIVLCDLIIPALAFGVQQHSWWIGIGGAFLVLVVLILGLIGRQSGNSLAMIASILLGLCWGGVGWMSGGLVHSVFLSLFLGLLGFIPLLAFHLSVFRKTSTSSSR